MPFLNNLCHYQASCSAGSTSQVGLSTKSFFNSHFCTRKWPGRAEKGNIPSRAQSTESRALQSSEMHFQFHLSPLPMAKDSWALQRCLVWVIPAPPQPWDRRASFLQLKPSLCFWLHTNPPKPISTTQSSTFTCWKLSPNCLQWNIYLSVWNSPPNNFWCNLHEKHPHK